MLRKILILLISIFCIMCNIDTNESTKPDAEGFGIFLTKNDIHPEELIVLSYIEPESEPIISCNEILYYIQDNHNIVLNETGKKNLSNLDILVRGKSFLVCIDQQIKYHGAFWTPASSIPFSGVVIVISKPISDTIRLQMGYPEGIDSAYYDPRNNIDVMNALEEKGKLM